MIIYKFTYPFDVFSDVFNYDAIQSAGVIYILYLTLIFPLILSASDNFAVNCFLLWCETIKGGNILNSQENGIKNVIKKEEARTVKKQTKPEYCIFSSILTENI